METLTTSKAAKRPAPPEGPADRSAKGQVVQSLTRALNLMTILGRSERAMTLSELAGEAALSPSTTHRLLTTLQQERYVRFDQGARAWSIGVQAYVTGANFVKTRNLVELAKPRMRRLMEESCELVNLAVEDNGEALYLARVGGPRVVNPPAPMGDRALLHCTAVGKVLLAGMTEGQVQSILNQRGMRQFTRTTLSSLPALHADLAQTRVRGFAVDQEERVAGVRCVAAPVYDENARIIGALSVSGSNRRIGEGRVDQLGEMARRTAAAVTMELGGRLPA
ncbi:IclR family transcriptional regulator [Azospirillum sp. ST 5-10]|uniref:IclR family transcriptional regulator n=1 Tax=unclassified Azospirillum TaxID=2630922 RepID=UPI003F49B49D